MWSYYQNNGLLISEDGLTTLHGYAGLDEGKNNPLMQNVPMKGPLPCARYKAQPPEDSKTHGPFAMHLIPWDEDKDKLFGRSGFMYHAESIEHPGRASNGCIASLGSKIMSGRQERELFWASGDHDIEVKPGIGLEA